MPDRKIIATLSNLRHQMGLLRVTKFADLHIMVPRYVLCEDTVEILQYTSCITGTIIQCENHR